MSDSSCSHACGGQCCRRFPLSMSPAKLGATYRAWIDYRDAAGDMADHEYGRDLIMIAEMVIPLAEESDETPSYTCRHFDSDSGLCAVYTDRPQMCRDYPSYGEPGRSCATCGYTQTPAEPAPPRS